MSGFNALLDEIEEMNKSILTEDEVRAKAREATDPDASEDDKDGEGYKHAEHGERDAKGRLKKKGEKNKASKDDGAEDDQEGSASDKPLKKSLDDGLLTLEGGEKAVDGTELVKSLIERVEKNELGQESVLRGMLGLLKGQNVLIKSLQDGLDRLSQEGRGRKAVVSIAEKQPLADLAKSEPQGINTDEFFAKALTAQAAGRVTSVDIATAEACVNRGEPVPASIIKRVMQ